MISIMTKTMIMIKLKITKAMKNVKLLLAAVVVIFTAISCNNDVFDEHDAQSVEKHTCTMRLVGTITPFDETTTRAATSETVWADGSVIYLRMESPMGITTGEAMYDAESDVWTISYYGSLYEGDDYKCTAFYVENKVSYENTIFTLDNGSAIYEDLDGTYIFDGGDLLVTANLKPRTGRMRFSGDAGKVLKIYGITHYTTYDIGTDNYTTTTEPFKVTVGEDGYTPYIYGYFTNEDEPNVKVWIDAKEAYTRFCSQNVFKTGQSGVFTIPTEDSHNGWADGLHFNINGAQFKMIAVEGGSFTMGDTNSTSEYYTPHKVTLTGYCIGETEVTNKLYYAITNSSTSKPNKPLNTTSPTTIIDKCNSVEKVYFDIPTEAQWEFAARGGVKSKGYIYSGSSNIDEVAWYYDNNDPSGLKDVKLKLPNELGIYDMSGNIRERVKDTYAKYANTNQTNPCITSGSGVIYRGGEYDTSGTYCTNFYRNYITTHYSSDYYGLRLVLNWND